MQVHKYINEDILREKHCFYSSVIILSRLNARMVPRPFTVSEMRLKIGDRRRVSIRFKSRTAVLFIESVTAQLHAYGIVWKHNNFFYK